MKKLIIILIAVIAISCGNGKWSKIGHINPENTCEFIVNDSISVIGTERPIGIRYSVTINDEIINPNGIVTWHCVHRSNKGVIDRLQRETNLYLSGEETSLEKHRGETKEKGKLTKCFKY